MIKGLRDPKDTRPTARHETPDAASGAAATAVAVPPEHPDAELLACEAEYYQAGQVGVAADDVGDTETSENALERERAALRKIAELPAHTAEGIAVKVRFLHKSIVDGPTDHDMQTAATALEALTRLGGKPAKPETGDDGLLFALEQEFRRLDAKADQLEAAHKHSETPESENQVKALWGASDALKERIAGTPARTIAGVAMKLRLAVQYQDEMNGSTGDHDIDGKAIRSALEDAERLAGGAS